MKFDAIEMMRSLSNRSFAELEAIGASEGVHVCNKYSKMELIFAIVAKRAEKIDNPINNNRKKYHLDCGDSYYLKLTEEQVNLVKWCINHSIDFNDATIEGAQETEWEAP